MATEVLNDGYATSRTVRGDGEPDGVTSVDGDAREVLGERGEPLIPSYNFSSRQLFLVFRIARDIPS